MALTMSDEQERARRKRLASPHVLMNGECFCSSCAAIAFKCELDAVRAKLAEAEHGWEATSAALAHERDMTAASQAEAAELRRFVVWLSTYEKNPPEIVKDDFAYDRLMLFIHDECASALSRAPGSREALERIHDYFDQRADALPKTNEQETLP